MNKREIQKLLAKAERAVDVSLKAGNQWGAPYAKTYIAEMRKILADGRDQVARKRIDGISGGIGKAVLDDYNWSEGPQGQIFFDAANAWYDYLTHRDREPHC